MNDMQVTIEVRYIVEEQQEGLTILSGSYPIFDTWEKAHEYFSALNSMGKGCRLIKEFLIKEPDMISVNWKENES